MRDRRGDAHRAAVTDVDRAADLLARRPRGERARERHRGAVDGLRAAAPGVGDAVGELVGARPRLLVRRERARHRTLGPRERDRVEGAVDDADPRGLRRVGAGGVGRRGVGEGGGLLDRGRCAADDRRRAARGDRDSGHGERAEDDHRRDQQNASHSNSRRVERGRGCPPIRLTGHREHPTSTGSGASDTPNPASTPSRTSAANASRSAVVPPPRWVSARRGCARQRHPATRPGLPPAEAGALDQPGRQTA